MTIDKYDATNLTLDPYGCPVLDDAQLDQMERDLDCVFAGGPILLDDPNGDFCTGINWFSCNGKTNSGEVCTNGLSCRESLNQTDCRNNTNCAGSKNTGGGNGCQPA